MENLAHAQGRRVLHMAKEKVHQLENTEREIIQMEARIIGLRVCICELRVISFQMIQCISNTSSYVVQQDKERMDSIAATLR